MEELIEWSNKGGLQWESEGQMIQEWVGSKLSDLAIKLRKQMVLLSALASNIIRDLNCIPIPIQDQEKPILHLTTEKQRASLSTKFKG